MRKTSIWSGPKNGEQPNFADLTGSNPNVMLELGAVLYRKPRPPLIPLLRVEEKGKKPELPIDLGGPIVVSYTAAMSAQEIAQELLRDIEKDQPVKRLLEGSERKRILTATVIQRLARVLPLEVCQKLAQQFRSFSAWEAADSGEIARHMGDYGAFASAVRELILEAQRNS